MKALLPLAAFVAMAATQKPAPAAPQTPAPATLARTEAEIAASETRAAELDRRQRAQALRLAQEELPTVRLLAALQRLALHPPSAVLTEPGPIALALRTRAALAAALPAIAMRTAALRHDMATTGLARSEAQDQARAARLHLAALVDSLGRTGQGDSAGPAEQRRLMTLPAPPLRARAPAPDRADPVYRLPAGALLIGTGERLPGGARARGVTLASVPDAVVTAPAAGRLAYAGRFGGYGAIAILDHGCGWTTLLAGLASVSAAPGTMLAAGAPIGRMPARAPRLTIELRRHGRVVDVAAVAAWRGG